MTELLISTSGGCISYLNTRVCYHSSSGWTMRYRNYAPVHLAMRDQLWFAGRIKEQLENIAVYGNSILRINEQVAGRLHVAGMFDLREARIDDNRMMLPAMMVGGRNIPVEVTTVKAVKGVPFSFDVVGHRHMSV